MDHCDNGEDGLVMAGANSYAVALVALTLPRLNGLSLVRELRAQGNRVPVVILSAKTTVADCVKGLQMAPTIT
ncbi:MAG: response regulator [Chthoniobacterales bacterium]